MTMTKFDLTTTEGRMDAITDLSNKVLWQLKSVMEISSDAIYVQNHTRAVLGLLDTDKERIAFASDIDISIEENTFSISVGSSGFFNPQNKNSYWKTIHASSLMKNYDKVLPILLNGVKKYSELMNEIDEANK